MPGWSLDTVITMPVFGLRTVAQVRIEPAAPFTTKLWS